MAGGEAATLPPAAPLAARTTRVTVASRVTAPASGVFALRRNPWNLRALSPSLLGFGFRLEAPARPVETGDIQHLHLRLPHRILGMELDIVDVIPDRRIVDVQRQGPFRYWRHEHLIVPRGEMESTLIDVVDFRLFGGISGRVLDRLVVRPLLWLHFAHQHRRLRSLLGRHGHGFWHRVGVPGWR